MNPASSSFSYGFCIIKRFCNYCQVDSFYVSGMKSMLEIPQGICRCLLDNEIGRHWFSLRGKQSELWSSSTYLKRKPIPWMDFFFKSACDLFRKFYPSLGINCSGYSMVLVLTGLSIEPHAVIFSPPFTHNENLSYTKIINRYMRDLQHISIKNGENKYLSKIEKENEERVKNIQEHKSLKLCVWYFTWFCSRKSSTYMCISLKALKKERSSNFTNILQP